MFYIYILLKFFMYYEITYIYICVYIYIENMDFLILNIYTRILIYVL